MHFPGEADTEPRLRISETVLGGEGAEKGKMCHRERENGRWKDLKREECGPWNGGFQVGLRGNQGRQDFLNTCVHCPICKDLRKCRNSQCMEKWPKGTCKDAGFYEPRVVSLNIWSILRKVMCIDSVFFFPLWSTSPPSPCLQPVGGNPGPKLVYIILGSRPHRFIILG